MTKTKDWNTDSGTGIKHWMKGSIKMSSMYIERPLTQTQGHTIRFYKTFLYIERARKQTLKQCIETLYRWIPHWLILRCNSGTGTLLCNLNLSSSKCGIVNILHTKIRAAFGIFLQKTHILINISFILLLEILKIK